MGQSQSQVGRWLGLRIDHALLNRPVERLRREDYCHIAYLGLHLQIPAYLKIACIAWRAKRFFEYTGILLQ
jgi:hypothetical protein